MYIKCSNLKNLVLLFDYAYVTTRDTNKNLPSFPFHHASSLTVDVQSSYLVNTVDEYSEVFLQPRSPLPLFVGAAK